VDDGRFASPLAQERAKIHCRRIAPSEAGGARKKALRNTTPKGPHPQRAYTPSRSPSQAHAYFRWAPDPAWAPTIGSRSQRAPDSELGHTPCGSKPPAHAHLGRATGPRRGTRCAQVFPAGSRPHGDHLPRACNPPRAGTYSPSARTFPWCLKTGCCVQLAGEW
jgi:hypothetical protein